jgi:arylsulfatase A-like enzyme
VPLIVKPPKSDPRRSQVAENSTRLVSHADVTPTILELACLPALPGQLGTSLLRESDAVHFAQTHRPEAKLDQLCLRDEHFKMIYLPKYDEFFFYDLESDPGELDDVYTTRRGERADWPERLRALARLAAERAKNGYTPDAGKQADLEALGYGGGD